MKKKSNSLTKLVIFMLVITMLALIALSATYAKYTSSSKATGTAVIAKWDVAFASGTSTGTSITVDLADTLTSKDSANDFIQPGSKGQIKVTVTNNSDVDATIAANLTDSTADTFKQSQFTVSAVKIGDGTTNVVAAGATADVTIEWEWTYDKDTAADTDDTSIGEAATTTAKTICTLDLTATQVDPNA